MAPQTVIRLSERSAGDGKFRVRVEFGGDAEYDVDVTDPADEAAEQELAWYFEEHLRYPFLDKDREREAVQRIGVYGEALFGQVFGGKASHSYLMLAERSFDGCRMEISGSAALHRLHWEALRDPEHPDPPLGVRLPVIRRVEAQPSQFAIRDDLPTLNILLVTARPGGPHDVGYRTISQPLLDALRNADQPVTVDLVRPGTWDALRAHLADATRRHGSGWYQVIHFDLHGAFTGYEMLARGASQGRLRFSPAALPPFDGQRGFLFFETERDDVAHPVPAETVASSLAEHRIPVAVLNACQSAMQTISEAGLAQRLAEAGVPVTVGMAYSVTVTAAEKSMPVLYQRLAEGADPVAAVHTARRELFEDRGRLAYYGQELDLEDWMLPVVFGQRPLRVELRAMTDAEQTEFDERSADVGDEPATEYGFVGRDLDIQAIERRLLASMDTNELLVRGMAGAGKSTLLAYLAWWWQRTGLVGQVFRFSYEDRAWPAHQIVRDIRAKLFTPAEHAAADSRSEAAQMEQVARRLRAHRHLLILDNAESITAAPASIPHALSAEEQAKLKTLVSRLGGGRTLVLLGSREPETWLTSGSAGPGIYPLPGLDPQASSVLVDRILARHNATRHETDPAERDALQDLVKLLGGYPLPLTVVLPVLATSKPSEVLAELREGGPGADPTGLIHRAIEYSHGKLDESLQNSLLLLAPFTAVIPTEEALEHYQELLLQDEAIQELGHIDLATALDRAVAVGLASPHSQVSGICQVQPVLPYFLRSRLHNQPALRSAIDQAHYMLYRSMASSLDRLLQSGAEPQQRRLAQVITQAEYANLTTALNFGLHTRQPIDSIIGPLYEYLTHAQQHGTISQLLSQTIADYPDPATQRQQIELSYLYEFAGSAAIRMRRLDAAKEYERAAVRLLEAAGERQRQAALYHQLGLIAGEQRQFTESEASYHQALKIYLEFGQRSNSAVTYHQLGMVAQEQQRLTEAESNYRQALEIKLEFGDRHSAASTYHQLGNIAYLRQEFTEAEASYRQALEILLDFGDLHGAASTYHQLGMIAKDQGRLAEAATNFRRSLDIFLDHGDRYSAARTYHQLGAIADVQRRFTEAESNYRQARNIALEFGDKYFASSSGIDLGIVLARLGRDEEASRVLLEAAVGWYKEAGAWSKRGLQWLRRERPIVGAGFEAVVRGNVPEELIDGLTAAIDAAEDSDVEAEPGPRRDRG
jgi:tetratricopeptide (TPR) repeat protein